MKKRNDITEKIRDGWVDQWKRKNAQGTGYYSFLTTQDVKSEGSKNRSPDFENPHKDRNFLSLNESFYYLSYCLILVVVNYRARQKAS